MTTLESEPAQTTASARFRALLVSTITESGRAEAEVPAVTSHTTHGRMIKLGDTETQEPNGAAGVQLLSSTSGVAAATETSAGRRSEDLTAASLSGGDEEHLGGRLPADRTAVFYAALASLQQLATTPIPNPTEWMRAARLLRRAAVAMRTRAPRTASVALLLSDALAFTDPEGMTEVRLTPIRAGLRLLTAPFVHSESEEQLFQSLLDHHWHTVAPFDKAALAHQGIE